MTAKRPKKPRARRWTWAPKPGDPDPGPFLEAIRKELRETKAHQMPGPRSIADIAVALGVSDAVLRARLAGRRPMTWEFAFEVAQAVGVAPPTPVGDAHQGNGSSPGDGSPV